MLTWHGTEGRHSHKGYHAPAKDPLPEALQRVRAAGRMRASRCGTDAGMKSRDSLCVPTSMLPYVA